MKTKLIISGGQTGADLTFLEEAKRVGIETGGFVPLGCKTDAGPNPDLVRVYGCVEVPSPDYKVRTRMNAHKGDITIWVGNTGSPGWKCTLKACQDFGKPDPIINPTREEFMELLNKYEVINGAGNRARINPLVVSWVRELFSDFKV